MNNKPYQLIPALPSFRKPVEHPDVLEIAEFFCDTIQGEGVNMGVPATFLRLQHCSLDCTYCDTQEVWRYGNPYTFQELFDMMEGMPMPTVIEKLSHGQHLVLTGGSPLKQQYKLRQFIDAFIARYGFKPYIEIENECTIMPMGPIISLIDCWNNSPKLKSSGNIEVLRYKPEVIKFLSTLHNSWFKFVIGDPAEWDEIEHNFLDKGLIRRDQIILMPLGATREELSITRETVVEIAIENDVRYTTREHIVLWDRKTGI